MTMETIDVCRAIHAIRGDAVVVTTMSAMRAMDQVAPDARLALSAVPLMGGSAGLALGIALAQPSRKLIVIDGDASLLMELGVLATVGGARPRNLYHFVMANGVQFNTNFALPITGNGKVDFAAVSAAAGYAQALHIGDISALRDALPGLLASEGPVLVQLAIAPAPSALGRNAPAPEQPDWRFERMGKEARTIMAELGVVE